jgi:hypothetical protein
VTASSPAHYRQPGWFTEGVGPDSSDEELQRIAPQHPVFRLAEAPAG